jgi:hypothetical protein
MEFVIIGIGQVGSVAACCLSEFDIKETGELTQLYWRSLDNYLDKSKVSHMFSQPELVVRFLIVGAARLLKILKARLDH